MTSRFLLFSCPAQRVLAAILEIDTELAFDAVKTYENGRIAGIAQQIAYFEMVAFGVTRRRTKRSSLVVDARLLS